MPGSAVAGHADFDHSAADRACWREGGDAGSGLPERKLCLMAANALALPAVEMVAHRAVTLRAAERVLGVRVLVEFHAMPRPA